MTTAESWNKQAEEMVKNWTGTQQKMFENWLGIMQSLSTNQTGDAWVKTVDSWQESVQAVLDAQVKMTEFWTESMANTSGTSPQMTEWSKQTLDMTKKWTQTQSELWGNWFDAMRKTDPASMMKGWNPEDMQKAMQTWQDATQKMMESQMEMIRLWTSSGMQPKS
jgi:hypothetical protein